MEKTWIKLIILLIAFNLSSKAQNANIKKTISLCYLKVSHDYSTPDKIYRLYLYKNNYYFAELSNKWLKKPYKRSYKDKLIRDTTMIDSVTKIFNSLFVSSDSMNRITINNPSEVKQNNCFLTDDFYYYYENKTKKTYFKAINCGKSVDNIICKDILYINSVFINCIGKMKD